MFGDDEGKIMKCLKDFLLSCWICVVGEFSVENLWIHDSWTMDMF